MIQSKQDLKQYLESDKNALKRNKSHPGHFDYVWRFEIALRKLEYYTNCSKSGGILHPALLLFFKYNKKKLGVRCGFSIPANVFEEGLSIAHMGTIVVNENARIGKNCRLHVCTNIGTAAGIEGQAPTIGDNSYIGPGAKIFGPITIGNGIAIGANAVVNKSFEMNNVSIAGVPAKVISDKGTKDFR